MSRAALILTLLLPQITKIVNAEERILNNDSMYLESIASSTSYSNRKEFSNANVDSDPEETNVANQNDVSPTTTNSVSSIVPDSCNLVMAPSSIEDGGWGMFSMIPQKKGTLLIEGDVVIQITDINPRYAYGLKRLLWEYLWEGQETGGQYEGKHVMSVTPSIGMLANGDSNQHNVLPNKPQIDDCGGLNRYISPGAGAFSHYHNFTWYAEKDIEEGGELFVNYGLPWFEERKLVGQPPPSGKQSLTYLRNNGYCLDNLLPGLSMIDHAGRGAFASRDLEEGSIVAPVPVLPVSATSMEMIKQHDSGRIIKSEQLLRNYCFGHSNSSLLLYPYSPMVNLINHSRNPNVRLQWSTGSTKFFQQSIQSLQETHTQLLLELIAIRPIHAGEEVFLDYGRDWQQAWNDHVAAWNPPLSEEYVSTYTIDAAGGILRTEVEQRTNPYPEHIFTSCFFQYSLVRGPDEQKTRSTLPVVVRWKHTENIFDMRYLRPCSVIRRDHDNSSSGTDDLFAVRIMNRPGLSDDERIPNDQQPYIVSHVPRKAIQFSSKLYTSDQHLEKAFRHEITLENFPGEWMDLPGR